MRTKKRTFRKIHREGHGSLNELNITPLLDLVFVLLVIFIITTPQLVNHLEMALPSAQTPPPSATTPPPAIQQIAIAADGKISLNDQPTTVPALRTSLVTLKRSSPDLAVVVKGSDDVEYQGMVEVLDLLRQLEITKVGLATQ